MKQLAWKQRIAERFRRVSQRRGSLRAPVILMYHGVVADKENAELNRWNITLREFARHIDYIRQEFEVVSLDSVVTAVERGTDFRENTIVITFDDAFANVFERARPILAEYGLPYTVAAPAGLICSTRTVWSQEIRLIALKSSCQSIEVVLPSGSCHWPLRSSATRRRASRGIVEDLNRLEPTLRDRAIEHVHRQVAAGEFSQLLERHRELHIMTSSQLRQLKNEDVTIAAHGWFHTPLKEGVDADVLQREVAATKRHLEQLLETPVEHFVYPHGQFCLSSIEMLKKSGYRSGLTTRAGCVSTSSDCFILPRIASECTLSHLRTQLTRLCA
jgi:peptidoglycan/xylan/chitin deacetylase (PgdA/CDA1 family)